VSGLGEDIRSIAPRRSGVRVPKLHSRVALLITGFSFYRRPGVVLLALRVLLALLVLFALLVVLDRLGPPRPSYWSTGRLGSVRGCHGLVAPRQAQTRLVDGQPGGLIVPDAAEAWDSRESAASIRPMARGGGSCP
jgi:hypothetical protein